MKKNAKSVTSPVALSASTPNRSIARNTEPIVARPAAMPNVPMRRSHVRPLRSTSAAAAIVTSMFVSFTASWPQFAYIPSNPELCRIVTR